MKRVEERYLRSGWHLLLTGLAVYEFFICESTFRKLSCGACAGWHAAAAAIDYKVDADADA